MLDRSLEGREWLVGDKMTLADLAWVPYNDGLPVLFDSPLEDVLREFPNVRTWHERMTARASWKKVIELKASLAAS